LSVGLLAYLLSLTIVRPLGRLSAAAAQVAAGNLDADVPVVSRDELGYLSRVFNDMVAQIRQSRDELEELSITDGLTRLYNRSHMMQTLSSETARCLRNGETFAVLMIDIDYFKAYNDTYGHLAGDEVLERTGTILREATREMDYAARYGGEEFLILLPETDLPSSVAVAERIRERFSQERFSTEAETRISISVGVAEFPKHGNSPESIIASADAALYEAKRLGRDRIVQVSPIVAVPDESDGEGRATA
jgi:diguanylate cyclase (GGDEF)-like protein